MSKNGEKNEKKVSTIFSSTYQPNAESTRFTSENQPSPEAKSIGWSRKRESKEIMDNISKYLNLSLDQLHKLEKELEANPQEYTVKDLMILNLVKKISKSDKFMIYWLQLHVPKADFRFGKVSDDRDVDEALNNLGKSYDFDELRENINT